MNKVTYREWRRFNHISDEKLASMLGVSIYRVESWGDDKTTLPKDLPVMLVKVAAVLESHEKRG